MDGRTRPGQKEYFSTAATGRRAAKDADRVEPSLDAFWLTMGHEGCSSASVLVGALAGSSPGRGQSAHWLNAHPKCGCGPSRSCKCAWATSAARRWAAATVLGVPTPVQSMMDVMESTRVDRWLWAVRLTKTRPDAAAACRGGHVRVNDRPAKPSTMVSPGDEVRARVGDTTRIVEVARVIQKRVGAADAVTCYLDRTPAPPPTSSVPVAARDRGAGRPTKRERRILDRWRAGQR